MKHIGELIEGAQTVLQQWYEKNQHLQQINQTLCSILPNPLAQHCRVVNVRDKTAVIYTDSAAWATRLRYLTPNVLQQWQQPFDIKKIEIKVHWEAITLPAPATSVSMVRVLATSSSVESKKRGPYPLTENAADYLRHTAEVTTHPRLKAVILRLASRSHTDTGCK